MEPCWKGPFTNANSNEFNNRRPTCYASKKYSRPVEKGMAIEIRPMASGFVVETFVKKKKINKACYPLRVSVFNRMANLQHDDFYLVLPIHARSEGVHDNRPQHFKVDLPKELFLEGEWEVGATELLYTHTFYELSRFALTYDLRDSDLMWEFTNRNVHDWIAVHFPRELYRDKSYRRLVLSMRDTLKEVGDKTGVVPGVDIVDLRDRFHVTMDPRASLRFSLPIAHMVGFMDDNFALRSQYKDGRFQIQYGVQRMSLVWVEQSGLLLRFEIAPLHGTANDNPRPFPRVESFSITSNLNIEPLFDGYKKSRDLRKIVIKRTSHVQETFSLALNPCMTNLLHSGNFGMYGIANRQFAQWNDDFSLLVDDDYAEVNGKSSTKEMIDGVITGTPFLTYRVREPSDKVISWYASHLAFQTIYIYSDVVESQVVGDVRANLLRVIAP